MGQRANLLIVRNRSYELYYSHWCANTLPRDLFWGPEYAVEFIELQTKVDESGWLNDIWAEGGAVLDLDIKKLLIYGGEDIRFDIPLRNLYIQLMQKTWNGWEIEWAYGGIADLASYVGYPKEKVLTVGDSDLNSICLAPPEEKDWVETVASVRFSANEMLIFPLGGGIEEYLLHGLEIVDKIDKAYGYQKLALSEWKKDFPLGGFHLDIPQKRLEFWHADVISGLFSQLQNKWPGWDINEKFSDYAAQLRSTQGLLEFPAVNGQQLLEELIVHLLNEPSNPLNALFYLAEKLGEEGKEVEISPYALSYNNRPLTKELKEEILASALKGLSS
ncbi:hypothetical protein JI735_12975 [Paenibacillus sonchi]|uniref:Uncharacterized protein n=1 Tax=Paenibacillus sonchi TaxID=373687 RepID=A0A974PGY0_9BACL|nr:hypothetical protein [Paenibacillus sonchi]QQZ63308.1 hypothetical protein JI735_12975 [Paenibacillus sonchi]